MNTKTTYELLKYSQDSEIPFQIGNRLGRGTFAAVYKATRKSAPEQVFAVKTFALSGRDRKRELTLMLYVSTDDVPRCKPLLIFKGKTGIKNNI